MRRTVAILLSATVLSACDRAAPPGAGAAQAAEPKPLPQHLKITVDGRPLVINPDQPVNGQVATAAVVNGRLLITAQDKITEHMLVVEAPFPGEPQAGELLSYLCKPVFGCEEPDPDGAPPTTTLLPAPANQREAKQLWHAYRAPKLGLEPVTVTLQSIQPVMWPGVGAAWRIKGTFRGALADAVEDWNHPRVNGPLRLVEGNFEMYAQRY